MGRHVEAAVVHDYLYMTAMWMRDIADAVFLAAMKAAEVPAWRRVMPPARANSTYSARLRARSRDVPQLRANWRPTAGRTNQ